MPIQPPPAERPPHKPPDAKLVRYDQYIDTQIRNTRRMVKVVDVATVLAVTALGMLAFLLAAAVVEHWLLSDGFSTLTRSVLFALLAGGVGVYLMRRLWPLCVRSINPVYAAQTIEQGSPSLKNSLLNLLLFRQRRAEVTDAVYETLEQQAAERLVRVPVDTAVDRTQLIRLGAALAMVVAACAAYIYFSPKDPLVTAERILMPWADVVPASRVSISNVEPGTTTLARGEVLEVSADVRGIGEDDPVIVRYTTADGQAIDRPVQMTPTAAGLRFVAKVPDDAGRRADEPIGVAQNLRYRIEAGDARSLEYAITVVAAPTITIQRIDYEYPDYTGFADHTIEGIGDIRAIEGTRVTIHARANGPIDEAYVDFEADGRRDVRMEVDGTGAAGSFVLALRDDRQTPRFTSYALRYTGTDGRPNREPAKFPIDVRRDYAPEVAIVTPTEKVRDVRLDETIALEVEARDPDFALAEVRLRGDVTGQAVFDEQLLAGEHTGRFTGRLQFTPRNYDLQAGDVVRYWGAARDIRTPDANETNSEPQSLRITSPDPNQPRQPPPDRVARRDPQPGEQQQPSEQQQDQEGQQQPGGGEAATADENQPQDGQQSGEPSADGQAGGESDSADGNNQPGDQQPGAGESFSRDAERSADPRAGDGEQQQNGQRRDRSEDASDRQQPPVSSEGDNDGEAFDRIRKFLHREGELPEQDESSGDRAPSRSDGQRNESKDEFSRDAQRSADAESTAVDGEQPDQNTDRSNDDPGAETRPGDPQRESAEPNDQRDDSQSPGGQQTSSKGPSGAGDQPEQSQGVPDSDPGMKPADKWQQTPSGKNEMDDQEPPAGGRGKKESDSQGDQGGDVTGGGEEGGGQRANREGTGSAGQNQSADEGSGESSEQGSGNTSTDAGRDAAAKDRTGESGSDQLGRGSSQRDGEGDESGGEQSKKVGGEDAPARSDGEQPFSRDAERSADGEQSQNDQPGNRGEDASEPRDAQQNTTDGEPASADRQQRQDPSDQSRRDEPSDRDGRTPGSEPSGPPAGAGQPTSTDSTAPEGDAANLEYARKQTDLVLEKLSEQLKQREVDKRLLDQLGWSEQDLARFLQRWQELKAAAEHNTPEGHIARRELDDALRSLGLRRGPLGPSQVRQDDLRDLREGYRGAVPLEYQERLRAYSEGVSRSRRNGE